MQIWWWPEINITYDQMLSWGGGLYHVFDPLMVIGEIIVVVSILLSLYYFRKGYKETFKAFAIISGIVLVIMLLGVFGIGDLTTVFGGERELAVMLFGAIYILFPLFLLMYVARDVEDNPIETPDEAKIERGKLLKIVATLSILLAIFFIIYGTMAIFLADTLTGLIEGLTGSTYERTTVGVIFLGFYYGIIGAVLLVGSIGLFLKNNFCRYLAIGASCYFFILGFPLAIALFLCEEDIKKMFKER
jgi:MFS family permease